jgi:hypothetical protein
MAFGSGPACFSVAGAFGDGLARMEQTRKAPQGAREHLGMVFFFLNSGDAGRAFALIKTRQGGRLFREGGGFLVFLIAP